MPSLVKRKPLHTSLEPQFDSRSMIGSDPPARARRNRLKQLRAFCETIRLGSISRAAEMLESSQPAVSNLVHTLEEELAVELFRRESGRVVPTRIGKRLFRTAAPLVEGLLRLPEFFDGQHFGDTTEVLRIGVGQVSAAFVLPELVRTFLALYPGTHVTLCGGTGTERVQWLRAFEVDVIVAAFETVSHDIEYHPLVRANALTITPEDHPLGCKESVAIEDLARYPLIVPGPTSYARRVMDVVLELHGVRPPIALEVDGSATMIGHVAAGVGIAIVPDLCIGGHEPVCKVRLEHPFHLRTYGVAVRRSGLMGLTAHRFVELSIASAGKAR